MRGSPQHISNRTSHGASPALGYVEQRSEELTYCLVESRAPRAALRVLAEQRLPLSGGQISLAIIGSSHFLEIESGDTLLCELLTCPRPGLEIAPRFAGLGSAPGWSYSTRRSKLSYDFRLWRHRSSGSEFARESARLSAPGPNRLRYLFPEGKDGEAALTCLEWTAREGRAEVATYHTFPGELAIVCTRSVIHVAGVGALP